MTERRKTGSSAVDSSEHRRDRQFSRSTSAAGCRAGATVLRSAATGSRVASVRDACSTGQASRSTRTDRTGSFRAIDLGAGPVQSAATNILWQLPMLLGPRQSGRKLQQPVTGTSCRGVLRPWTRAAMVSAEGDVFSPADPNGSHLWSKRFGDSANQLGLSIAFDAQNNILLAGSLVGAADFGGGPLASAGGNDVFVAKLDPKGDSLEKGSASGGSTGPASLHGGGRLSRPQARRAPQERQALSSSGASRRNRAWRSSRRGPLSSSRGPGQGCRRATCGRRR